MQQFFWKSLLSRLGENETTRYTWGRGCLEIENIFQLCYWLFSGISRGLQKIERKASERKFASWEQISHYLLPDSASTDREDNGSVNNPTQRTWVLTTLTFEFRIFEFFEIIIFELYIEFGQPNIIAEKVQRGRECGKSNISGVKTLQWTNTGISLDTETFNQIGIFVFNQIYLILRTVFSFYNS